MVYFKQKLCQPNGTEYVVNSRNVRRNRLALRLSLWLSADGMIQWRCY